MEKKLLLTVEINNIIIIDFTACVFVYACNEKQILEKRNKPEKG